MSSLKIFNTLRNNKQKQGASEQNKERVNK